METKQQEIKKEYTKPEVVKHGKVEEVTKLIRIGGSSSPVFFSTIR